MQVKNIQGWWCVIDGEKVLSVHETNQEAWREMDRLTGETTSRSEGIADWLSKKVGE